MFVLLNLKTELPRSDFVFFIALFGTF